MKVLKTAALVLLLFCADASSQTKPAIQHAKTYKTVKDISDYWISEKLDGMRGYWNGKQLFSRQGNIINSPPWFTKGWPSNAIDGELWIGRNQFQQTLSCIKKRTTDKSCWKKIRFMIFDLPKHNGVFTLRIKAMEQLVSRVNSPYLTMIRQFKVSDTEQLERELNITTLNNGEGLMLHHGNAYYHVGRTANIMKLKKHQDDEAIVIGHLPGKGKYQGMLGALQVEMENGKIFKIGTGFKKSERAKPPAIGSVITFTYNGKTQAGIPRFARFLRVRDDRKD